MQLSVSDPQLKTYTKPQKEETTRMKEVLLLETKPYKGKEYIHKKSVENGRLKIVTSVASKNFPLIFSLY